MSIINTFKKSLAFVFLRKLKNQYQRNRQSFLKTLNQNEFESILINELNINSGDTLFIHSSLDKINLSFSPFDALNIILDIVGTNGTILFPTYPLGYSYNFLKQNQVFNKNSPYFKLYNYNSKIIGIGVKTTYLSCVHTVDDTYKNDFIVEVYHNELFNARCINYNKEEVIVPTYAHNMKMMKFNLPNYFNKYIDKNICSDLSVDGYNFFKADAKKLFDKMINLYENENITIYPKNIYKRK